MSKYILHFLYRARNYNKRSNMRIGVNHFLGDLWGSVFSSFSLLFVDCTFCLSFCIVWAVSEVDAEITFITKKICRFLPFSLLIHCLLMPFQFDFQLEKWKKNNFFWKWMKLTRLRIFYFTLASLLPQLL